MQLAVIENDGRALLPALIPCVASAK